MSNAVQLALKAGQAIWLDHIRRGLIKSGEFQSLVELGISGVIFNPDRIRNVIMGSSDYDAFLAKQGSKVGDEKIYEALTVEDTRAAADLLRFTYDNTGGEQGYACIGISPLVAFDKVKVVSEGKRLFSKLKRPNVMVSIAATEQGIAAIRPLTAAGVNVNIILIFSLDAYRRVRKAYIAGLHDLVEAGGDPAGISSAASLFLSRIDTAVDNLLMEKMQGGQMALSQLLGKVAVASAKLAYEEFKEDFYGKPFDRFRQMGVHVQRPVWASTGTKNPAYSDLKYVEPLIGMDTVNVASMSTIRAFIDHGKIASTIEGGVGEAKGTFIALQEAHINMQDIADQLLLDGVRSLAQNYVKLIASIEEKKGVVGEAAMSAAAAKTTALQESDRMINTQEIGRRIWQQDHTLWKPDPTEITNRLGWLTVTDQMRSMLPMIQKFSNDIRKEGYKKTVILGMGGSSLGAEVISQVLGRAAGFPDLTIQDSTVPEAVSAVASGLDMRRTLFLLASKSGTTTEPLALFKYFKGFVTEKMGEKEAGRNFVAITDPGMPLVQMAEAEGFRKVFLNPCDIGGRYSILSCFGLVPAALVGVDLEIALDYADRAREACASCVPALENPGLMLGKLLGTAAIAGRNKLTLITSPRLQSFGLWVEQLVAESTGKEGKGILPVVGETPADSASYGDDRVFVYLRLNGDRNSRTDRFVKRLESANIPVTVRTLENVNALWAEFYIWEFATAVAGAIFGVNPFDQPDVQRSKDATKRLLKSYGVTGQLPAYAGVLSVSELLEMVERGKYLAILAYIRQTIESDRIFDDFRKKVSKRCGIATTLGYGPRYLHSTGQLHKGGPDGGLFIQVTVDHDVNPAIAGERYGFAVIADAQAAGDLEILQDIGRPVALIHCPAGENMIYETLRKELHLT